MAVFRYILSVEFIINNLLICFQTVYETWNPHGTAKYGRYHGHLVNFPYHTKDNIQQRRYAAQKIGTTYVYDFPEMFRQAIVKAWKDRRAEVVGRPRRQR
jgi:hypothetical protein